MSSKLSGIVGQTGTGKSTSIKHLNPKETYIINVAKKELPFKGAEKFYNDIISDPNIIKPVRNILKSEEITLPLEETNQ